MKKRTGKPPKRTTGTAKAAAKRVPATGHRSRVTPWPPPVPIVALDVRSGADAAALVDRLGALCRFYKVGSELFAAAGPAMVEYLRARGCEVFLDLKLHDIPNTVAGAARAAAATGARLITVHAAGGPEMIRAAVAGAREGARHGGGACDVLAVTLLTSLDAAAIGHLWGRKIQSVEREVVRLAQDAVRAGAAGVVCSGQELPAVRSALGPRAAVLVPGVRPAGADVGDQVRTVTPGEAARGGANYVVLGRAVTQDRDPRAAFTRVAGELAP